jgi:hypothetical protein
MGLQLPHELPPGQWALEICTALGADSYVNPAGGRALFDNTAFISRGIALRFAETFEFRYQTGQLNYEPGLSILDVLMWVAPREAAAAARNNVRLVEPTYESRDFLCRDLV